MNTKAGIQLPLAKIIEFCQRHHIRRLSLFGSVLREDFGMDSDIDFLVEFEPVHQVSYLDIAGMELELSEIIERKADLRTPAELSPYFRQEVLETAELFYDQERSDQTSTLIPQLEKIILDAKS